VLLPLAEVAGEEKHPALQQTYAELWQAYDKAAQQLWPVDFDWRDQKISSASV
jgi:2-amino-4-hydroxy-6-hydroxymethyldihydropteridine diphosphokinase